MDYNSTPDSHLSKLLIEADAQKPLVVRVFEDFKEYFFPPKLPPLEVTSKPIAVKDIWGVDHKKKARAGATSVLIHASVVALALAASTSKVVQDQVKNTVTLIAPDISDYVPQAKPKPQPMGGGGGGGDRSPTPASLGKAPKAAPRQFVPPAAVVRNDNPKLVMEPTILVPTDVQVPNVNLAQWGDPLGKIGPPSNGTGSGGGIGSGSGGGIGSGKGGGFGPGEGGGIGGNVYRLGGGVSAPVPIYRPEPEYSEEARKAKFQGTVLLSVVIDEKGNPAELKVVRPLGLGLDEKALEAVRKWKFKPGYLNGKAVAVMAQIEVNFRLL